MNKVKPAVHDFDAVFGIPALIILKFLVFIFEETLSLTFYEFQKYDSTKRQNKFLYPIN